MSDLPYWIHMAEYTLTKQIAKHGRQSIIVIPRFLEEELKPKTLVEIKIKILRSVEGDVK